MIGVPEKYELEIGAPAPISSARQHEEYLTVLERLARKANPTADEEKYALLLLALVGAYEQEQYLIPDASPVAVLRTLMEANGLRQKDLASLLGSESVVSEVVNGKRELNKGQIEKLSKRFHVSPAVFF
jgi:HTH-type transcriptional regulator / antitoxin HigA